MEDKNLIKKAIDKYDAYSPSQREILKLFIDISINNFIEASVKYISEKTQLKKSTVYFAINLFLKDGFIQRDIGASKALVLSENKINYIVEIYKKKYSIKKT